MGRAFYDLVRFTRHASATGEVIGSTCESRGCGTTSTASKSVRVTATIPANQYAPAVSFPLHHLTPTVVVGVGCRLHSESGSLWI